MNLAVAFTEYQLLQVQALANHYKLKNLYLIILDNDRIQPWLIDNEIYEDILVLPAFDVSRVKRVSKSYIEKYEKIVKGYLNKRNVEKFIGAQDENTIYVLIKTLANPDYYWNIEDGFANYYTRNFYFKSGIWFKKKIFKYVYNYDLPISYAHGQVFANKSFRMLPEFSSSNNEKIPLGNTIQEYLHKKAILAKHDLSFLKKYENVTTLIITDLKTFKNVNKENSRTEVYKFHPKDHITEEINVNYIIEKMPIEILCFILPNLQKIRFEVMSSSIINLSAMQIDMDLVISFTPKTKHAKKVINYISQNFHKEVKLSK